jgi:ubiquinone/menaquinone biosynthesis C-methylase UbiE
MGQNILVLGCGNSTVPIELHKYGFKRVTGIDLSSIVVAHMQHKYRQVEGLHFLVADACHMTSFQDATYDCIIDKGCLVRHSPRSIFS